MRSLAALTLVVAGCQCGSSTPPSSKMPTVAVPAAQPTNAVIRPGLELPAGTGTPPPRSPPLDEATVKRLAGVTFHGFTADVHAVAPSVFEVRQLSESRPKLAATITIKPCFDCLPMVLDTWKQRRDALEMLVDDRLRDRSDTEFEIGATELAGTPAIFTYQAGQSVGTDHSGNLTGTFTDAYALYYNDGVNEIRVVAEYKDDPAASKDAMVAAAPREQLDRLARAFGDLYVHAW
ncbi:MAG TPA: hypothetical protein VGO00_06620 [Kofleriaceae bacterium]|nr:hypothetical protein [Kofleriaceae bacterium]